VQAHAGHKRSEEQPPEQPFAENWNGSYFGCLAFYRFYDFWLLRSRARNHQSNAISTTCRSADDTRYREKQPPLQMLASDCIIQCCERESLRRGPASCRHNSEEVSKEAEREELETVAEALGRSSRLANLLHYIGEKYFRGESSQLNEYNIATEVFARSKTTFDAGKDAIARVETHRLRKRLQEFYEGAGRGRPIQLSIPSGAYVPVFSRRAAPVPSAPDPSAPTLKAPDLPGKPEDRTAGLTAPQAVQPTQAAHDQSAPANVGTHALSRLASPIWLYSLLAAALILSALWSLSILPFTRRVHSGDHCGSAEHLSHCTANCRPRPGIYASSPIGGL
jgi:hypothetical protein